MSNSENNGEFSNVLGMSLKMFLRNIFLSILFALVIFLFAFSFSESKASIRDEFFRNSGILTAVAFALFGIMNLSQLLFEKIEESRRLRTQIDSKVERLQTNIEEDFFTKLVQINFTYIEKYYLQTQTQANNSFLVAVTTSIVAFLVIATGIILMYFNKTNSAYIATGAGTLSQFIAAVFFYLYNKTVIKMGEYHHKLVLTQNISLAMKVSEDMIGEEKIKGQMILIEQLTKDINLHIAAKS